MRMRNLFVTLLALGTVMAAPARAAGPAIDWDPAYMWQTGGSATNLPLNGEFKIVGIVSLFDFPFQDLNALDPGKEYTFYCEGLISQGTQTSGAPGFQLYTTQYSGGTFKLYEDTTPEPAAFDPNPPNGSTVPENFVDGTLLLEGSFTSFVVQTNDFTAFMVGNIEGEINWTGGSLLSRTIQGGNPCPGLFTGGATWYPPVLYEGYLFRHDGKIDMQCPTSTVPSTWGRVKSLYR